MTFKTGDKVWFYGCRANNKCIECMGCDFTREPIGEKIRGIIKSTTAITTVVTVYRDHYEPVIDIDQLHLVDAKLAEYKQRLLNEV